MADIALVMGDYGGDIQLDGYDLLRDDGLETSVIISLFSDSRASADQVRPDQQADDLRGYWGDVAAEFEGDSTGSLLWLLYREKQTGATLSRAKQYCADALKWMIDDRVATKVEVQTRYPERGIMEIKIDIYRPGRQTASYRYYYEWASQAVKRAA